MEPNACANAWGYTRVANALTPLAKMRQSADNICVLTPERRPGTDAPASAAASLVAVAESAEVKVARGARAREVRLIPRGTRNEQRRRRTTRRRTRRKTGLASPRDATKKSRGDDERRA